MKAKEQKIAWDDVRALAKACRVGESPHNFKNMAALVELIVGDMPGLIAMRDGHEETLAEVREVWRLLGHETVKRCGTLGALEELIAIARANDKSILAPIRAALGISDDVDVATAARTARSNAAAGKLYAERMQHHEGHGPIPMLLWCPSCNARHVDAGEFATRPHRTHCCQRCGMCWRPAVVPTVGVRFLPGFKDATP
jgi:hypothetical protein